MSNSKGISKSLSDSEKLALRNKAKAECERLKSISAKDWEIVEGFKNQFAICEIVYKIVLRDHQSRLHSRNNNYLTIDMRQVPFALKYAGYDFDNELLTNLFGSGESIGKRSVKKLRDALTHSIKDRDIEELKNREQELYGYMNSFLDKIQNFDVASVA